MLRIFRITLIHQGPARKRLFLASGLAGCRLAAGCISDLENRNYSSGVVSPASGTRRHHEEVALFSFDDRSFPYRHNLFLTLVPAVPHPLNPIVHTGAEGSPDVARA